MTTDNHNERIVLHTDSLDDIEGIIRDLAAGQKVVLGDDSIRDRFAGIAETIAAQRGEKN